ncbi:MAG: SIMPL domain-containing protein [Bacteroidota bacterium]
MSRLFFLAFLLPLLAGQPAVAQDSTSNARTIQVEGEATVQATPDQATVRFGVVTRADAPEAAREENGETSSAAMEAARAADVPEDQIQMDQLQLRPRRVYDEERRRTVEQGFEAIRTVRVTLNEVDRVPVLVAAVIEAGANRVQSVEYGLQDRTEVRNQALEEAAQNAREKAERLAAALDVQIGAVRSIQEQHFSFPRVSQVDRARATMMNEAAEDANPEAYAPGTIDVEARVAVVFDLDQ